MIKVLLVDDEIMNLRYLDSILSQIDNIEIVGSFSQPLLAIEFIEHSNVDIAFLDIELPDINGIELAVKLQNIQAGIEIVFITAYSHYAIEAFNIHALHYLLKPIKVDQITKLINYFKSINSENKEPEILQKTKAIYFDYFRLLKSNGEEVKFPTKKTLELCAYFLLHSGQKIPKYRILEDVWPEIDEEKASQNFHITLFRLRNIIKCENIPIRIDAVRGSNEGYICHSNHLESDLEEYVQIFDAKKIVDLDEISYFFKSINGRFLEHNYFTWSNRFQLEIETQMINRTHQLIRETEFENRDKAIEIAQTVLKVYSTDESLMMHYFNLLLRKGETYQIMHEFENYKKLLKKEFNILPSSEISDYVKKVIR